MSFKTNLPANHRCCSLHRSRVFPAPHHHLHLAPQPILARTLPEIIALRSERDQTRRNVSHLLARSNFARVGGIIHQRAGLTAQLGRLNLDLAVFFVRRFQVDGALIANSFRVNVFRSCIGEFCKLFQKVSGSSRSQFGLFAQHLSSTACSRKSGVMEGPSIPRYPDSNGGGANRNCRFGRICSWTLCDCDCHSGCRSTTPRSFALCERQRRLSCPLHHGRKSSNSAWVGGAFAPRLRTHARAYFGGRPSKKNYKSLILISFLQPLSVAAPENAPKDLNAMSFDLSNLGYIRQFPYSHMENLTCFSDEVSMAELTWFKQV